MIHRGGCCAAQVENVAGKHAPQRRLPAVARLQVFVQLSTHARQQLQGTGILAGLGVGRDRVAAAAAVRKVTRRASEQDSRGRQQGQDGGTGLRPRRMWQWSCGRQPTCPAVCLCFSQCFVSALVLACSADNDLLL